MWCDSGQLLTLLVQILSLPLCHLSLGISLLSVSNNLYSKGACQDQITHVKQQVHCRLTLSFPSRTLSTHPVLVSNVSSQARPTQELAGVTMPARVDFMCQRDWTLDAQRAGNILFWGCVSEGVSERDWHLLRLD